MSRSVRYERFEAAGSAAAEDSEKGPSMGDESVGRSRDRLPVVNSRKGEGVGGESGYSAPPGRRGDDPDGGC